MEWFKRLLAKDDGIELVEYVIIASLIVASMVVAMAALGGSIASIFSKMADVVAP